MKTAFSTQEMGRRIAKIRKTKNFSQEELARMVGVSRPSLAQIEQGNRKISATELLNFSLNLDFSLDGFFAATFDTKKWGDSSQNKSEKIIEERNPNPEFYPEKFENLLLYVLENCAGKVNVNESMIQLLFYFADFNYYEKNETHWSGLNYIKLKTGPRPENWDAAVAHTLENGQLKRVKFPQNGGPHQRLLPMQKPDLTHLKASEVETADQVLSQLSDYSAAALAGYARGDLPWQATEDGQPIDYELAFYREPPYSARRYETVENDF